MSDRDDDNDSGLGSDAEEVPLEAATDPEEFMSMIPHFYRGEVSQATTAQDRIDRTTDWAVALIAALLSAVFSSPGIPAHLLLIGIFVVCTFLWFEVRRYRFYDLFRSRIRFVQENVFANLFDPAGADPNWREQLGDDLRAPTFKVSFWEALSRRIRRVYGLLLAALGVAWLAKVTLFTPEQGWAEAAALPGVSGIVVAVALGAFYVVVAVLAFWPGERKAMGEVYGVEAGDWKDESDR